MAKGKREVQRELYNFIAEQEEPVILQTLLDKFCAKYNCSERTISRFLEEMINSKNPFHLRTWYDKNRYYEVLTLTLKGQVLSLLSIIVPLSCFFVDLYNPLGIQWYLVVTSSFFVGGFWSAMWLSVIHKKNRQNSTRKIS